MHPDIAFGNLQQRACRPGIREISVFVHIDELRAIARGRKLAAETHPGEGAGTMLSLVEVIDQDNVIVRNQARRTLASVLNENTADMTIVSGSEGADESIETIGDIHAEDDAIGLQPHLRTRRLTVSDDKLITLRNEVLGADERIIDLGGTAVVGKGRAPVGRIVKGSELPIASARTIPGNEDLVTPAAPGIVGNRSGR